MSSIIYVVGYLITAFLLLVQINRYPKGHSLRPTDETDAFLISLMVGTIALLWPMLLPVWGMYSSARAVARRLPEIQ